MQETREGNCATYHLHEGDHFNVQLVLVLGDKLLGVVGSVEVLAL